MQQIVTQSRVREWMEMIHSQKADYHVFNEQNSKGLNPYAWNKYLLTKLPKHQNQRSRDMSFMGDLMPLSDKFPEGIHKN